MNFFARWRRHFCHEPAEPPANRILIDDELLDHFRAVVTMPAWVLATAHDLTIDQAVRLQAAVGELLLTSEACR